ncbi:SCO6745 family protein [Streptomyces sp. CA-253872]|uniref:SCO6745 family protein n=1 Tax=Streptomyces sp. CA-253872 TaxID=3240067 RepID=UPI003D93EB1F
MSEPTRTPLPERAARRCHNAVNPLHSFHYFSPELAEEMGRLGLGDASAVYLATRAAAFGQVGAGVVTASFYNFSPELVARHVPAVWGTAFPGVVLQARLRTVDRSLRRLLGDEAVESAEMKEAARLALRATEACTPQGRPLYAAHADLPVPEEPHLAYWHAATLLREHRGDGHVHTLLRAGLGPVEALVTHTATGRGMVPRFVLASRGWHRADWEAAVARLRERGLLDAEGELTEAGEALRARVEAETDALDQAPYEYLGAEDVARLTDLAKGFTRAGIGAGAFPAGIFGKG